MVTKNIIKFLKKGNSLYINGLGLFEKRFVSSNIENGKINPPHNELILNTDKEGNGFEFVLFVSQEEGITMLEADDMISKWTNELNEKIETKGSVSIENFGTFLKKEEKNEFQCVTIPELNDDYEGMEPIDIPEKVTGTISGKGKEKGKGHNRAVIAIFVILLLGSCGFVGYIFRDQLQKYAEDILINFGSEVTLPAVSGEPYASEFAKTNYIDSIAIQEEETEVEPVTIPFISTNNEEEKEVENVENNESEEVFAEPENTDSQINTEPENTIENKTAHTETGDYPHIDYEKGKYYAIAGSFGNEKDAKTHAAWKKRVGYEPQLLYQTGSNRIRICVAVFDSSAEALSYKEKHPDCWILE